MNQKHASHTAPAGPGHVGPGHVGPGHVGPGGKPNIVGDNDDDNDDDEEDTRS